MPIMALDPKIRLRFAAFIRQSGVNYKTASTNARLGETYVRDVIERERGTEGGIKQVVRAIKPSAVSYVIDGHGELEDTFEEFVPDEFSLSTHVRVMGKVGAGAEIRPEFEQVPEGGLDQIDIGQVVDDCAIAFEVDGDSMYPRYEHGDIVVCDRQGVDIDQIVGWEAVVKTGDGRRFLKTIRRGSKPGVFDLESHNASTIRDVDLEWVGEVSFIVRASKWRKPKK